MPELNVISVTLSVLALLVGLAVGWLLRSKRSDAEKAAVNAGWQEQFEAQRGEHERLLEQNKSLMQQNSQYQASNKDSKMRATELSEALREAFERRDELQRQVKDIRSNLEAAVQARAELQSELDDRSVEDQAAANALQERDETIARLTRDVAGWRARVPPLIERFRERNEDANRLDKELTVARERIAALEDMLGSDETRVEPVDREALGEDLDASNETMEFETMSDADSASLADAEAAPEHGDHAIGGVDAAAEDAVDGDAEDQPTAEEAVDGDDAATAEPATGFAADRTWARQQDAHGAAPSTSPFARGRLTNGEHADDLKLIKGVGPAIEKTLRELGIRRFEQIAAMSEYDIDRIARRLKGFRSRIYREDWIGQARELQARKTAEAP